MSRKKKLSSKIIGQISLMQSVVAQLPDKTSMIKFVCHGFKDIPGVENVRYFLSDGVDTLPWDSSVTQHAFSVRFQDQVESKLIVKLSDLNLFSPYIPFVENFCTMLGVIFDKQHQQELNITIMNDLEQRVRERTKELELEIIERKQIETELRKSEQQYRDFVENTDTLVTKVDSEGRFVYVNHTANKIFGISPEECVGLSAFSFINPNDRGRTEEWFNDCIQGKIKTSTIGNNQISRSGIGREIIWTVTFNYDEHCQVTHINSIGRDITKLKILESQLRQSQKMEAIGTIAGGIAHDFNNILGIVLGNIELAITDIPEWNPAKQNLKKIKQASFRAKEIVRQLLTFTRKTAHEKEVIPIQDLVKETIGLLRASIPTSVDLKTQIQEDTGSIKANATQIHQVLVNLCTNAVYAMDNTGVLEIKVSQLKIDDQVKSFDKKLCAGSYIKLSVKDNGIGISKETQEKIFDPYFTTKEIGKGTGMGLSVVHGIVNGHDGEISIQSEVGKGTCVNIIFPEVSAPLTKIIEEQSEIQKGNEKILFVDDEPSLVELAQTILQRLGYEVEAFVDPVKAFVKFESDPESFDLIITDMTMPKMTGDQLSRKVLKIRPTMPIILCTGYNNKISEEHSKKIGIRTFLQKPLGMNTLAATIRSALDVSKN